MRQISSVVWRQCVCVFIRCMLACNRISWGVSCTDLQTAESRWFKQREISLNKVYFASNVWAYIWLCLSQLWLYIHVAAKHRSTSLHQHDYLKLYVHFYVFDPCINNMWCHFESLNQIKTKDLRSVAWWELLSLLVRNHHLLGKSTCCDKLML